MIAELARGQGGVLSRRQLAQAGVSRAAIEDRLASGHLHRIHRGVYAAGHLVLGVSGRRHAALLASGPAAALGWPSAGAVWDLCAEGPRVHVMAPTRRRSRPGIVVHQARLDPSEVTSKDGLRVTTVARTLVDLAGVFSEQRLLRSFERAERLRILDMTAVRAALERRGRQGVRKLRAALLAYDPDHELTKSELERVALTLSRDHGLPRPEVNGEIGPYLVDLVWRQQRLAVELDGWDTHRTRIAFERDRERDRQLTAAGWRIIRVTWRQLTQHTAGVAADLAMILRESRGQSGGKRAARAPRVLQI